MGTPSAQELSVVVHGLDSPAHELLEDIAWQIQPQAVLRVDPMNRTVTLARTQGQIHEVAHPEIYIVLMFFAWPSNADAPAKADAPELLEIQEAQAVVQKDGEVLETDPRKC